MKKVKIKKLNLNKQTISNLGKINGGKTATAASDINTMSARIGCNSCTCTKDITCAASCAYTCNTNCESNNSNCYCG